MSLSLTDLHGELREYFGRIEEVLSGMDAVVAQLEARVAKLEGRSVDSSLPAGASTEQRIARLEGQLAALVDSLYDQGPEGGAGSGEIILGR